MNKYMKFEAFKESLRQKNLSAKEYERRVREYCIRNDI